MTLTANIAVNLGARVWSALMSFAFVPLYIRFMGIEGYGLIGLFVTLQAIFSLLDLGLGLTVNREMGRRGSGVEVRRDARSLLRTLEAVYWVIGAAIGLTIALAAPLIARDWINIRTISLDEATRAIRLMGMAAFVRWPVALYLGALLGMQRQVAANAITAGGATLAGGGAVVVLWLVSPSTNAFFAWQIVAFGCQSAALRVAAWRGLALADHRPRISFGLLRASAGFSAGIMGITLLSLILTQLDKLLLTRLLPLEEFGYYTLAAGIAGLLTAAGAAVETAVFPMLTAAVAQGDHARERELYHKASQGLAVLLMPTAVTVALFSGELLTAYIGDSQVAANTGPLLGLLVIGQACLAAVYMPLSLQLAHGWTSLSFYKNIVAVILFVPLLLLLVPRFGAIGAALAWLALTLSYVLFEVPVMHRRLLQGEQWRWYLTDMGIPLLASLAVQGLVWLMLPSFAPPLLNLALIALGGGLAVATSVLALPRLRQAVLTQLVAALHKLRASRRRGGLDLES
jgi:O-antigen/teichoic acid export membrane protein